MPILDPVTTKENFYNKIATIFKLDVLNILDLGHPCFFIASNKGAPNFVVHTYILLYLVEWEII